MGFCRQFLLILWKNFKLQIRHPFTTLYELLLPAFIGIILIFIRVLTKSKAEISVIEHFSPKSVYEVSQTNLPKEIWYAPTTSEIHEIIKSVTGELNIAKIEDFNNEGDLVTAYENSQNKNLNKNHIFAIVFHNQNLRTANPIEFTIRPQGEWETAHPYPLYHSVDPKHMTEVSADYLGSGFLAIQHYIVLKIIKVLEHKELDAMPKIFLQRFPALTGQQDTFLNDIVFYFPFAIILSYMFPCMSVVKNLVHEKERKLKVFMKLHGLNPRINNLAWFIQYTFYFNVISLILMLFLIMHVRPKVAIFVRTDPSLLLFILTIYSYVTICFAFFMYSLFDNARSAAVATPLVFFLATVPYMFIFHRFEKFSFVSKISWCLIFNTAISETFNIIVDGENKGDGIKWASLISATTEDQILILVLLILMVLEAFLFLAAAWYAKKIFPGEYTAPEVWYFLFTDAYWAPNPIEKVGGNKHIQFSFDYHRMEYFESDPIRFPQTIKIRSLAHVYPMKSEGSVRDIFLNMYEGQVTVLLGQKNSGKTTILSIVMGLFPPTSGYVLINNKNVVHDIQDIRRNFGICPQKNVLFDDLTAEEHLYFFVQLKRYSSDIMTENVEQLIQNMELDHVKHIYVRDLTFDDKRRLAIAIAFVGESSIVLLDDPTAGMDSASRGKIWNFIKSQRIKRTIVLATSNLEEAEIVGDRIAILANGEIQCCGSPLFLNKKYGVGYHLNITKGKDCNDNVITKVILSFVPDAELCKDIDTKMVFILPRTATDQFEKLFLHLEKNKETLNIVNFGASVITMEEIFKTVGQSGESTKDDDPEYVSEGSSYAAIGQESGDSSATKDAAKRNSGSALFIQHISALLSKHILFLLRNWTSTLTQFLTGPLLLTLVLCAIQILPIEEHSVRLQLNVAKFSSPTLPFEVLTLETPVTRMSEDFQSLFNRQSTISVKNMTKYLTQKCRDDFIYYSRRMPIAATFTKKDGEHEPTMIGWYNTEAYHTPAIALWAIDNVLYKKVSGERKHINVYMQPLPKNDKEKGIKTMVDFTGAFQISLALVVGFSVLVSNFSKILIKELETKSKYLQITSGTSLAIYWSVNFLWHYFCYSFFCILCVIPFRLFGVPGMSNNVEQGWIYFLFALHGFAYIPIVYSLVSTFNKPTHAASSIGMVNIIIVGISLLILTLTNVPRLGLQKNFVVLDWVFSLLIPTYNLGEGVSNMYQNQQVKVVCRTPAIEQKCYNQSKHFCCKGQCGSLCFEWTDDYYSFSYPGIGKHIFCLIFQSIFVLAVILAIKFQFVDWLNEKIKRKPMHRVSNFMGHACFSEDEDVQTERQKILLTPLDELQESYVLLVKELTKCYGLHLAVNRVTFGVRKGECFGLLGINGSGKTSIIDMLTGVKSMTSGGAYIAGHNLRIDLAKAQKKIGYCPQIDSLLDHLTGEETLYFYCRLRGIPEKYICSCIKKLSSTLMFMDRLKFQINEYNDTTKRKLSVAIALIGRPAIIFLDEPTLNMDLVSKRCTWNLLTEMIERGQSILMGTSSMEECEILCNRLAIVVNGKLTCLGSPEQLVHKFGKYFTLFINVARVKRVKHRPILIRKSSKSKKLIKSLCGHPEHQGQLCPLWIEEESQFKNDIESVKTFISDCIPGSVLKDSYEGFLQYHVPDTNFSWSEIFRLMEMAKRTLNITDYSVGQTTLHQILMSSLNARKA